MDFFSEFIVKRKLKGIDMLISIGGFLGAFILSVFIPMLLSRFPLFSGFSLLLVVGAWYGAFMLMKSRSIEYEYILTNNEMDIDKIIAKRRRKRLITINFRQIDICAKIDDPMYKHEYDNSAIVTKTLDCTGVCENDIYFVDFAGEGGKTRVLFQPTEKMKENLFQINPRAIHIPRD